MDFQCCSDRTNFTLGCHRSSLKPTPPLPTIHLKLSTTRPPTPEETKEAFMKYSDTFPSVQSKPIHHYPSSLCFGCCRQLAYQVLFLQIFFLRINLYDTFRVRAKIGCSAALDVEELIEIAWLKLIGLK